MLPALFGSAFQEAGMNDCRRILWLVTGIVLGVAGTGLYLLPGQQARAANDRYEDYVMCTGPVGYFGPVGHTRMTTPLDGVWLLDYRTGKLLGTVIDRGEGKIIGWADVDMVTEFGLAPRQNVHFLMTTGNITNGKSALYVAETNTGKVGVYTMGPRLDGQNGVVILRHDLQPFRQVAKAN
jgi:hypothetical protein